MMNRFIALLLILISFASCQLFKKQGKDSPGTVKYLNKSEYFSRFENLKGKMKVTIVSDAFNGSMLAFIRMRQDSLVWGSVTAVMGIEAARFFMNRDSITIIDKLHKTYYTFSYEEVGAKYGFRDFNYYTIESLLTGRYLFASPLLQADSGFQQTLPEADKIEEEDGNSIYTFSGTGYYRVFYQEKKTSHIWKYIIKDHNRSQHLEIEYKDQIRYKKFSMPETIILNLFHPYRFNAKCSWLSVITNEPFEINMEIPANYDKGN